MSILSCHLPFASRFNTLDYLLLVKEDKVRHKPGVVGVFNYYPTIRETGAGHGPGPGMKMANAQCVFLFTYHRHGKKYTTAWVVEYGCQAGGTRRKCRIYFGCRPSIVPPDSIQGAMHYGPALVKAIHKWSVS